MTSHSDPIRVVLAPDSFKGTASAIQVCAALRAGWLSVRPQDDLCSVPLSDGGEGLLDAAEAVVPESRRRLVPGVRGPDGRPVDAQWLELPGGRAVVELAQASGLSHVRHLDVWGANTYGTGEVVRAAALGGATSIVLGLGGSASVDGGLGVLQALGLRLLSDDGVEVCDGARGTAQTARVVTDDLIPAPAGGVLALTDVRNPALLT